MLISKEDCLVVIDEYLFSFYIGEESIFLKRIFVKIKNNI